MAMQLKLFHEDESKTIGKISDVYICKVRHLLQRGRCRVGVTRLDYKIADNDRDAIFSKMNSTNKTNQIFGWNKRRK